MLRLARWPSRARPPSWVRSTTPTHAGRAYVFTKTASGWKQTAELKGSDTVGWRRISSASSVAISGTTAVVGATATPRTPGGRTCSPRPHRLEAGGRAEGLRHRRRRQFGYSVAISGTTVVVGADDHANGAGRAYVFTKTANGWKQAAELKGSDTVAGDFGSSVAISGTTAVVGADHHANSAGRAYVFTETADGWKQTAELKGSDTVAGDSFGTRWPSRARPSSWVQTALPANAGRLRTCSPRRRQAGSRPPS